MPGMQPLQQHNARQFYLDIFWFGVVAGSTLTFLSVFAARQGASAFQLALLTGGPAVVNLLISLPAARWLEGRSLIRATFLSSLWHRSGYLLLVFIPLFLTASAQTWALPALVVFMSVAGTVLTIAFNAMFADLVPPEMRALVVGRRNALLALSMTGTSLFSGWLLDAVVFPLNYQLIFALGLVGAAMSSYYLARLRPAPPRERLGVTLHQMARPGLLRIDLLRGPFGPFMLAFFAFYTFQFAPVPLLPLLWVEVLNLSDTVISIGQALTYAMMFLVSLRLSWLTDRLGNHRVLWISAVLFAAYPLLMGLARGPALFLAASVIGGIVWGAAGGVLLTRLMERAPEDDRPAHMALHNLALNLGILCGSLLGPVLGEWLGLRDALLVAAGLRLLGGLLLMWWG